MCKEPWQQETLLCEAARGSWLARELVRARHPNPNPKPKPKPNPNPNPNPKPHPDPDPKHKPKPKPSPNQVRAKLATRDTDHCDPKDPKGKGCRYEPCVAHPKGLAKALINVADGWRSPLNDPTDKLYLALRPVQP